jgi:hypothetical protein
MRRCFRAVTAFVLAGSGLVAVPPPAAADVAQSAPSPSSAADDLARLKRDLDALQQDYASRVAAIEARIAALEGRAAEAAPEAKAAPPAPETAPAPVAALPPEAAPPPEAPPPPQPAPPPEPPPYPTAASPSAGSKMFNPDMAAIGNFVGAAGKSPGGGEPSLNMQEGEFSFQAVVDPYARADFFVTVGPDEVGLEEGYITFPTLPGGLLAKVGKMRDAFGRVDPQHVHTLPWADRPFVTRNLTGGEDGLADAGISVARLIPNPWLFLEATGQVYQGNSEVFKAPTRGDLAYVGHLRAYRDLGESTNIDVGGSIAYGHNGATADATTRLLGVDATLRWKPLRRSIYTHFLARGEVTWSRADEASGAMDAVGGYGYLEYQFGRRWTAGLRYDNSELATSPWLRDKGGSLVLTYRPSEFSLVRAQYRRTTFAGTDGPADELLFQFLFAIGAHGAHPF